jgi:ubiquinone/menaquinone biosynthesis C-methylase UbiE
MVPTVTRQAEVQDHYRTLAPKYGARANRTCERTYRLLVQRFMGQRNRILELGSGSTDLLDRLGRPFGVATDLSVDMLLARAPTPRVHRLVAAGERLPFRSASFDGLFNINVLEHVTDLDATLSECARVLTEEGLWLAVTPNGNWEFWLDLAERWSLKIPEGPHSFLTTRHLHQKASNWFEIVEHRTFLMVPAGPPGLARLLDRISFCSTLRWGFFQYMVARKRSRSVPPALPRPDAAQEVSPKPAAGAAL